MTMTDRTLTVGPSKHQVELCLTDHALDRLDHVPGGHGVPLSDHREILTTVTVAKAAAGELHDDRLTVHGRDIEAALA